MDKELYKLVVDEIDVSIGDSIAYCDRRDCAKAVVEMLEDECYRKADEVRKETAKEIADWLECQTIDDLGGYRIDKATKLARIIRQKYGVEVDE